MGGLRHAWLRPLLSASLPVFCPFNGAHAEVSAPLSCAVLSWEDTDTGEACLTVPVGDESRWEERVSDTDWRLLVSDAPEGADRLLVDHAVLGQLRVSDREREREFVLPWRYWCPSRVESVGHGALRIHFQWKFERLVPMQLASGVDYFRLHRADGQRSLTCHVLRVDLSKPGVTVRPALAHSTLGEALPVSQLCKEYGALAGINGAFFSLQTAETLGLVILNRKVVSGPVYHRSALLLGESGARVAQTALALRLRVPSGETYECDAVNTRRGPNRLVLFNRHFGPTTNTPLDGLEMAIDGSGKVIALSAGNTAIPPSGWIISAHGQAAHWLGRRVKLGSFVQVRQPFLERWKDARDALGAGPRLLAGGELKVQAAEERFARDVSNGLAPRSAVGIDRSGRLILMAVEGRYPPRSSGLSLRGVAELLREFGAVDGLNLDGGGSTQMVVGDEVVTRSSNGWIRPVSSALLVFAPEGWPLSPDVSQEE